MYNFEEIANDDEIKKLILRTNPTYSNSLELEVDAGLSPIFDDFSIESYSFCFKNRNNEENWISLTMYTDEDLSDVLGFLCDLIKTKCPICTLIQNEGEHGIFYARPINDNQIHFVVADDYELYRNFCTNNVHYSFEDAHICLDIVIDKKQLIKQFYDELWEKTQSYKDAKFDNLWKDIQKRYINLFDKLKEYLSL